MNTTLDSWHPILEEAAALNVMCVVQDIASALIKMPVSQSEEIGLSGGIAGRALFFSYLAQVTERPDYRAVAEKLIGTVYDRLPETTTRAGLYAGFPGIVWAIVKAERYLYGFSDAEADDCDEIDQVILEMLQQDQWAGHYDLVAGLVGLGVYILSRPVSESTKTIFALLFKHLNQFSVAEGDFLFWRTPCRLLFKQSERDQYPDGNFNLGLAHGVPGVIGLLARAISTGHANIDCRDALIKTTEGLISLASGNAESFYSYCREERAVARVAWCYGDLGVAMTIYQAGRSINRQDWIDFALNTIDHTLIRPIDKSGVVDTGLCHGSAGIAHILNRVYQSTRIEKYRESALFWINQTLAMRQPNIEIAGFPRFDGIPTNNGWAPDSGFLMGVSGIGLALATAVKGENAAWDEVLLV